MIKSQIKKLVFLGIFCSFLLVNTALATPITENNVVLIPLRETMENLGIKVQWHSEQ